MEKSHDDTFFDAEDSNRITLVNDAEYSNRATLVNDNEDSNRGSLVKQPSGSKSSPRASDLSYSEKGSKLKEDMIEEKPIEEKLTDEIPPPDYPSDEGKEEHISVIEHAESNSTESPAKPLRRRRRVYNHLKRRWYFYAAGVVIFLAIFLPILFLVIFPAIAQRVVNVAALPIHWVNILDPGADTIGLSFAAGLKVPLGLTISMDPFQMSLYDKNDDGKSVTYLNANLPHYKLKGKANLTVPYQVDPILDKPMFINFMSDVVNNQNFTLRAKSLGKVTAHLGKLKAKVNLKKDINLIGLEKFKGVAMATGQIVLPPEDDGTNFFGNISIPNQSIITADMGNISVNVLSDQLIIGTATLYRVYLFPGPNLISFRGIVDFGAVLKNLRFIYAFQAPLIKQGKVVIGVTGTATVYNGVRISYIETVMNSLRLDIPTAIKPILTNTLNGIKNNILGAVMYVLTNFEEYVKTLDLSGVDLSALKTNGTVNATQILQKLQGLNFTQVLQNIESLGV